MSKFVIAGASDCPYYAKAELLADDLKTNLPDFKIHKIVKHPDEWKDWLENTCSKHGWMHNKSPLVWRELVDRGGKGLLIGGANEFQEYAMGYFGVKSKMASDDMKKVSSENMETKLIVTTEEEFKKSLSKPLHVCITDASTSVAYCMVQAIARGDVFGRDTEVSLRLLSEDTNHVDELEGVKMEAFDLACPMLKDVTVVTDVRQAFTNINVVIMIDEIDKDEEMDRKDWLKKNAQFFMARGEILDEVASRDVKVIVAGHGPVNFNTYLLSHSAPSIPRQNFVAQARLRENYAKAVIAKRLTVNSAGVVDLLVWGNVNGTSYTDVTRSRIHGYDGAIWGPPSYNRPVMEMVHDNKWLETEFVELVKTHKETVEGALGHGASTSNAASVTTLLSDWWNGSPPGRIYSLGIVSDGWYYDLPEGIVFSLPVKFQKGNWEVVQDLEMDELAKEKLQEISLELKKELHVVFPPPFTSTPPPSEDESEKDEEKLKKVFGQEGEAEEAPPPVDGEGKTEEELNAERQLGTITEEVEPETTDTEARKKASDTERPSSTEQPKTSQPTTPKATTPQPTSKPTTPQPTSKPTTPQPTSPKPTTPQPTSPKPTTPTE